MCLRRLEWRARTRALPACLGWHQAISVKDSWEAVEPSEASQNYSFQGWVGVGTIESQPAEEGGGSGVSKDAGESGAGRGCSHLFQYPLPRPGEMGRRAGRPRKGGMGAMGVWVGWNLRSPWGPSCTSPDPGSKRGQLNVQSDESARLHGVLGHAALCLRGRCCRRPGLYSCKQLWEMCPWATGVSSACSLSWDCEDGGDHADGVSISES